MRRSVVAVIERSFILEHLVLERRIGVIGAMHHLDTGLVDFDEAAGVFTDEDVARLRGA